MDNQMDGRATTFHPPSTMLGEIGKMYWLPEQNTEIIIPNWCLLLVPALLILLALWIIKKRRR